MLNKYHGLPFLAMSAYFTLNSNPSMTDFINMSISGFFFPKTTAIVIGMTA